MNSQKYAQETALSRRVKEWEDGINPHLAAQVMWPIRMFPKMYSIKNKYRELPVAFFVYRRPVLLLTSMSMETELSRHSLAWGWKNRLPSLSKARRTQKLADTCWLRYSWWVKLVHRAMTAGTTKQWGHDLTETSERISKSWPLYMYFCLHVMCRALYI